MTDDIPIPQNLDALIDQVNSETAVIASCTLVHSKKSSVAHADETSKKLGDFLERNYALEAKGSDIAAARVIGTFHWYGHKLSFPEKPDLNQEDVLKRSTLKILEIRNYDADAQQDNRATFVMSTDRAELETVFKGVSSFYMDEGYSLHKKMREIGSCANPNPQAETKF